jgi:hypothetical protein
MYIPLRSDDFLGGVTHGVILNDIEATYRAFVTYFVDPNVTGKTRTRTMGKINSMDEAVHGLEHTLEIYFLAFLKAYNSELPNDHPHCYYSEREWRCLINLKFKLEHVKAIAIHKNFEKRALADFPDFANRLHIIG